MDRKRRISRVDVQVSIVTAVLVTTALICVYFFNYFITHEDMINSLKERSHSIYQYVDDYVDKTTFQNTEALTRDNPAYIRMKEKLEEVKASTNVRYLYTAEKNIQGEYVYLVDGLPYDSSDFRNPGDKIEEEIIPELTAALHDKIILPNQIKNTEWGPIFISYFPIHKGDEVVGVLGIEFDATHQYRAFQIIRIGTPIIAAIACLLAVFIAVRLFKRISNPMYKDMANTDFLTGLKNRNAFELDIQNKQDEVLGILIADLNGLKKINDEQGHQIRDEYIRKAATVIGKCASTCPVYRFGGDEFVVLVPDADDKKMKSLSERILTYEETVPKDCDIPISLSVGYALYDPVQCASLQDVFHEADVQMYKMKNSRKI